MKSDWIRHKGIKILYSNYSNLFESVFEQEVEDSEKIVCSQFPLSVLEMIDLNGVVLSPKVVDVLKKSAVRKKGFISKEAVYINSVSGPKKTLIELISRMSGQQIVVFNQDTEAKDWLITRK